MASTQTKLATLLGATAAAVVIATMPQLEGRKFVPYKDTGGILTYCAGITSPKPVPGHTYTLEECIEIESAAEAKHAEGFLKCIKEPEALTDGQKVAGTLFTYNVGVANACSSSFVKNLNAGKPKEACDNLMKWKYVRVGTEMKDCSIRSNNCYGVYRRRQLEQQFCMEGIK